MYYSGITKCDVANGNGFRVVLWVSGCDHHCPGCHNPETWNPCYGKLFDVFTALEILDTLDKDYIEGLTLSGGDPLKKENVPYVYWLVKQVKEKYPNKDIWCWTGDTLEQLENRDDVKELLKYIDVLVDGEFIQSKRDITLAWRGSSNQKIYRNENGKFVDVTASYN